MSFYQNLFKSEFLGVLVLGDRQHSPTFKCRPNAGRGDEIVTAWKDPGNAYDFSGNDVSGNSKAILNLNLAIDPNFKNWMPVAVNVTTGASSAAAETPAEVVAALNAAATFSSWFEASLGKFTDTQHDRVIIRQKKSALQMRFYIANGQAETVLGFNARAGVDQLPTFFDRHTIANRWSYDDSLNHLIKLNTADAVDAAVINTAVDHNGNTLGYSSASVKADWELLRGRAGLFTFKKQTVDASSRITQIIEYPAGALAGDFSKKTTYTYTGAKTAPDTIAEVPYTLQSGDLITP